MPEPAPEDEGIGPEDLADSGFAAWYAERARAPRPVPGPAPGPVTSEQFEYRTPEKFELYDGYLFGPGADRWYRTRRADLLALLLTNTGLEGRRAPRPPRAVAGGPAAGVRGRPRARGRVRPASGRLNAAVRAARRLRFSPSSPALGGRSS